MSKPEKGVSLFRKIKFFFQIMFQRDKYIIKEWLDAVERWIRNSDRITKKALKDAKTIEKWCKWRMRNE